MDRIELFRIFRTVVDCASFTGAAGRLGMPRSSVSLAVQALEARVGARLLHRTTRRVAPTQDGLVLYDRSRSLIEETEELERLFRGSAGIIGGRVRVDVPGRIGRLIVVPALPDFLARYPGVDVVLGVGDRSSDLIDEGIDCVLRVGDLDPSSLVARRLGDLVFVNVASADYLARHGVPRTMADLDHHRAVLYASPSTGRVEQFEWVDGGRSRFHPMQGRVTVDNAEALIAAAVAGLGIVQVPLYDVRAALADGGLIEVLPDHRARPMPMHLLFPSRRDRAARVQVFADWLAGLVARDVLGGD